MPTNINECGQKIQDILLEYGCKFEVQHNVVLVPNNDLPAEAVADLPTPEPVVILDDASSTTTEGSETITATTPTE